MKNFVLIYFASLFDRMGMTSLQARSLITITMFLHAYGSPQEMNLNEADNPRSVRGNQQTADMFLTYTPVARLDWILDGRPSTISRW
jgi:hypothetical protein